MGKMSKNILIAAIAYVAVLIFDSLCTFIPSIGQPIQEWAGVAISLVADLLFAWVFIELLRHETQKSITKDASIMGLVSVGLLVLGLIASVLSYILILKPSQTEDSVETYNHFNDLRFTLLYVPGTLMMIASVLRLAIAHGRNLLVSIGGWLYGITFSLFLIFYAFGFIYVVFPWNDEYMFWYNDARTYTVLAGNIGTSLFLFGLSMKDVQGRQTRAAHTPAVSHIFYYASFMALSFGSIFLLQDLQKEKISWLVDFHIELYSALALVALAATLILIGLTIVRTSRAKNVLKRFPTKTFSSGTQVVAFVFAGILLLIGVGLLFSDSKGENADNVYAFSSMALAAGLVLVGVINWMNSKTKQHLLAPSRSSASIVFYILGYLCMAAFLVIALVNIGDGRWHDFYWYIYGFRGTTGIAIGLALVGIGYLCQYNCNIKTLDTLIPEQKESLHEQ